jgi:hypothetical protein
MRTFRSTSRRGFVQATAGALACSGDVIASNTNPHSIPSSLKITDLRNGSDSSAADDHSAHPY